MSFKRFLSYVFILSLVLTLYLPSVSAQSDALDEIQNLMPITDENFLDCGYGTNLTEFANHDLLGKAAGTVYGVKTDTETVKDGNQSLSLFYESSLSAVYFPMEVGYLESGEDYTFQAYVKTDHHTKSYLSVEFKVVEPEYKWVQGFNSEISSDILYLSHDWTLISVTFTVPEDPNTIVVLKLCSSGEQAWFDDLALVEGNKPKSDIVKVKNYLQLDEETVETMDNSFDSDGLYKVPSTTTSEYLEFDTETLLFGNRSIMFNANDVSFAHAAFYMPSEAFEPGKTYTFQAYVKGSWMVGKAYIQVEAIDCYDNYDYCEELYSDLVPGWFPYDYTGLTGGGDWTLLKYTFTMPESNEGYVLSFYFGVIDVSLGGAWFDGFAVVEGDKPIKYYENIAPILGGTPSAWAKDEIIKALEADLVPSHINSRFTEDITRSDFCDLIINMIEKKSGKAISDVIADYADAKADVSFPDTDSANVIAAAKLGIVNGRSSGAFDPTANITRQEAAKMLALAAKVLGADITASEVAFADADSIYDWAKEFIYYVNTKGVMNGTSVASPPNFSPLRTYTREQSILTVYRLFGAI